MSDAISVTPLLALKQVSKNFGRANWLRSLMPAAVPRNSRVVHAVSDVTLIVNPGEAVGIVGESGCGKSTLGRIAARLLVPDAGAVELHGTPMAQLRGSAAKEARRHVQMIFQSPIASLNPRQKLGQILEEALKVHMRLSVPDRREQVGTLLGKVGLSAEMAERYPRQLSGGQAQRVGIARALTVGPKLIVCDEPVSALDVSVQAQILNLFQDLRESLGLSYMFISHDLSVVERVSDRVAVMYLGEVVEEAPTAELFARPGHPYTMALLEAAPALGKARIAAEPLRGERPSPYDRPPGCSFHPRCKFAMDICRKSAPPRAELSAEHFAACHLHTGNRDSTIPSNSTSWSDGPITGRRM
jgi:peptide/nickel transport system ATP-binding protein